jgi:hypothetical protein
MDKAPNPLQNQQKDGNGRTNNGREAVNCARRACERANLTKDQIAAIEKISNHGQDIATLYVAADLTRAGRSFGEVVAIIKLAKGKKANVLKCLALCYIDPESVQAGLQIYNDNCGEEKEDDSLALEEGHPSSN